MWIAVAEGDLFLITSVARFLRACGSIHTLHSPCLLGSNRKTLYDTCSGSFVLPHDSSFLLANIAPTERTHFYVSSGCPMVPLLDLLQKNHIFTLLHVSVTIEPLAAPKGDRRTWKQCACRSKEGLQHVSPCAVIASRKEPVFIWEAQNPHCTFWCKVFRSVPSKYEDFVMCRWRLSYMKARRPDCLSFSTKSIVRCPWCMTIPYIRSEYLKVIPEKEIKKLHKACQAEYLLLWLTSHLPVMDREQNELFGCIWMSLDVSVCMIILGLDGFLTAPNHPGFSPPLLPPPPVLKDT